MMTFCGQPLFSLADMAFRGVAPISALFLFYDLSTTQAVMERTQSLETDPGLNSGILLLISSVTSERVPHPGWASVFLSAGMIKSTLCSCHGNSIGQ